MSSSEDNQIDEASDFADGTDRSDTDSEQNHKQTDEQRVINSE